MSGREAGRYVRVAAVHPDCHTLGPGRRCVVWVQGCPLDCAGCITPEWIPDSGGTEVAVSELADWVAEEALDGLTLSGGEPFAQAEALARLVGLVRARRDLSVMSYSGWTLEHLRAHGTAEQHRLLDALDILVDGPYVQRRHGDLRWRGSDNQRVHHLTPRHLGGAELPDRGAGLQFVFGPGPTVRWMGVPAVPGFREAFVRSLGLSGPGEVGCGTAPHKGRGAVTSAAPPPRSNNLARGDPHGGRDQPPPARGERIAQPAERLVPDRAAAPASPPDPPMEAQG